MKRPSLDLHIPTRAWFLTVCAATLLSACGGGASDMGSKPDEQQVEPRIASGTTTLQLNTASLPDAAAAQLAQPAFHVAPVLLNAPDDTDAADNNASARMGPRMQFIPQEFKNISSRGLTLQALKFARQTRGDGSATPMASSGPIATYSPAQIRAAYGLPALPTAGTALSATQAAQLGAGQTIYLLDANSDPNIAAELAAFNQKFGLPTCITQTIATNATLPLAAAPSGGCVFSVVYSNANGAMTATAPAYDSGWATEIALDVQ
ncbi:MAG TPA: peptidase S53, partial [Burkholderiaceae bacterium]|nr:peptidase S53 [Burkholderiaceae bacterium]